MESKEEEINDIGEGDKDVDSHFFRIQGNELHTSGAKPCSPQLSPRRGDTFLQSAKGVCLEGDTFLPAKGVCSEGDISALSDDVSSTQDNVSSIELGDSTSGVGESLSGIGDGISGLGENISGLVDRMMAEISPGVMDLSGISAGAGDGGLMDGSDRESEESDMSPLNLKQQHGLFDPKLSVSLEEAADQHSLLSPRSVHRQPSGPFVAGDQTDVSTGMFVSKFPDPHRPAASGSGPASARPSVLASHAGLETDLYAGHSLLSKWKWLPHSPEKGSVKKLKLEYQSIASRPLPRQQKVRTDLSLADKVHLISVSESTGKSQRALAAEFCIAVGSVNNILRRKREYREAFENQGNTPNTPNSTSNKTSGYHHRPAKSTTVFSELQMLIMQWVEVAKVKIKPLTWPVVMEKAREFAAKMSIPRGSLSAAWLEGLRQSLDLPLRASAVAGGGLRAENDASVLGMWHKMLPFLLQGYTPENIFSVTETTLYYRCLPDCCYIGGPMCQSVSSHMEALGHRLTVLLCCTAQGERLKPLVISRRPCPRALQGLPVEELPVVWCTQARAAITPDIFSTWLRGLEASMAQQRRHIALFMEMNPSHLSSTLVKHVSLKFYLDDSSHLLQPLNQGVVRTFKAYFRRRFLQTALASQPGAEMGVPGDASHCTPSFTELDAAFWIQEAWRSISVDTIRACFHKSAFPQHHPTTTTTTTTSQPSPSPSHSHPHPYITSSSSSTGIEPLPSDFVHLVHEAGRLFRFTPMSADVFADFDSQQPCHCSDLDHWERGLLLKVVSGAGASRSPAGTAVCIKREPGGGGGDSGDGGGGGGDVEGWTMGEEGGEGTVRSAEALDSLGKLKRFSASNIGLLTTVYELESLLLDSLGSSC